MITFTTPASPIQTSAAPLAAPLPDRRVFDGLAYLLIDMYIERAKHRNEPRIPRWSKPIRQYVQEDAA